MRFLDAPAAALAWLGRQGMRAVAISVFAGLALPPLAALFKPIFAPTLVMMLLLAFLRADPVALRGYFYPARAGAGRDRLEHAGRASDFRDRPHGFGD